MSTSWPFERNWPVISASRSHATHGWYSVRSLLPPRYSFVAIVNVATCLPDWQRPQLRVPGQPSDEQHLVHFDGSFHQRSAPEARRPLG